MNRTSLQPRPKLNTTKSKAKRANGSGEHAFPLDADSAAFDDFGWDPENDTDQGSDANESNEGTFIEKGDPNALSF